MRRALPAALAAAAILAAAAPFSGAEVAAKGSLRVSFAGKIRPQRLPRHETAPIAVSLSGEIRATDGSTPPQLRQISLAISRHGRLDTAGLPACRLEQIQPATSQEALANCGAALVGEGSFRAHVDLPDQSPFPSNGRVLAFNARQGSKTAIFAHIYGAEPLPTSYVLPFILSRQRKGAYSVTLVAHLPRIAAQWGFVSGISITLNRTFRYRNRTHSYLSAGCPAPPGFPGAVFSFARASFGFEGGQAVDSVLTRSCEVR